MFCLYSRRIPVHVFALNRSRWPSPRRSRLRRTPSRAAGRDGARGRILGGTPPPPPPHLARRRPVGCGRDRRWTVQLGDVVIPRHRLGCYCWCYAAPLYLCLPLRAASSRVSGGGRRGRGSAARLAWPLGHPPKSRLHALETFCCVSHHTLTKISRRRLGQHEVYISTDHVCMGS